MTAKELIKLLETKGFYKVSQKGSHLKMKDSNGHIVIIPIHTGDLKKGTERAILKDAGL